MNTDRFPAGTLRLLPSQPQAEAPGQPAPPTTGLEAAVAPVLPDPAEVAACKQANLQREREARAAAVVRRRQQTREVLALLRTRWPEAFTAPVPLAVGVAREIKQSLGETHVPRMQLGRALHYWMHAPGYLAAVAAGQRRMHLDGTDAGEPDEVQRQYAQEILAQRAAQRAMRPRRRRLRSKEAGEQET